MADLNITVSDNETSSESLSISAASFFIRVSDLLFTSETQRVVQPTIFTASGSSTTTAGASLAQIEAWGGGGGGGNGQTAFSGGGGGGGAYSLETGTAVTQGVSNTVTVGGGGAIATVGGDSSFINTATVLAKGGGLGANAGAANNGAAGAGGASGSGVGDTKFSGGNGAAGGGTLQAGGGGGGGAGTTAVGSNAVGATAGAGGSLEGGKGGNGLANGAGSPGVVAGGGGGGGGNLSAAGAVGAAGQVIVDYLFKETYQNETIVLSENNQMQLDCNVNVSDTLTFADTTGSLDYLRLPGTSGSNATAPDAAALDIVGDIDLRVLAVSNDWTPSQLKVFIAKAQTGATFSYALDVAGTGMLRFAWSVAGTTVLTTDSTVAPTIADGGCLWVRATMDVDNGAGSRVIKFYTSTDVPQTAPASVTWTQLGATVTTAGTTSIFSSTSQLELGSFNNGTANLLIGKILYAEVRNGYDGAGSIVANPDLRSLAPGTTSFADTSSNTFTVNGSATVTEDVNITLVNNPNVSDTLTFSENIKLLDELNIVVNDTLTLSEFVNRTLVLGFSVSDTATLSEFINATLVHNAAVSDTLTFSESIKMLLTANAIVSDTLTFSEVVTMGGDLFRTVSDTLTFTEFNKMTLVLNIGVNDNMGPYLIIFLTNGGIAIRIIDNFYHQIK